ncbi:hypothetical protein Tco_1482658 [Tanacetum coccineum]
MTMSILPQDEPLTNWPVLERPKRFRQAGQGNRFASRCPEYIRPPSKCLMEAHLTPARPAQVNKITTSCEICSGPHDTQYCMKDPEQAFVEFAFSLPMKREDLHLNLPVLEVLAHALIYNAILDKYAESLDLGKNGSTFVQREIPVKMEDPGLFTLPCRLGDSKPFDTLADIGSCVNIIPLYLFKKLNIGLLEETDHIFRLADGT